jgi:CRP/FNR family transcriptional regulator, anaerobic regulatory protein
MSVIPLYRQEDHPQAEVCRQCSVRQFALFGALSDEGLDTIHTRIETVEFAPGEAVFDAGQRGTALFTVRSGVVRFERVNERGDWRITRLAGRGDLLGAEALVQFQHADAAVACTPVVACRIPRELVDELCAQHPRLVRDLMRRWQAALEDAEEWLSELATGSARRRMLRLMMKLASLTPPNEASWLPKREEMGAMLGLTLETASRLVSQFKRENLILSMDARQVWLDVSALTEAAAREDRLD